MVGAKRSGAVPSHVAGEGPGRRCAKVHHDQHVEYVGKIGIDVESEQAAAEAEIHLRRVVELDEGNREAFDTLERILRRCAMLSLL